jgi:hypothetical protein
MRFKAKIVEVACGSWALLGSADNEGLYDLPSLVKLGGRAARRIVVSKQSSEIL